MKYNDWYDICYARLGVPNAVNKILRRTSKNLAMITIEMND